MRTQAMAAIAALTLGAACHRTDLNYVTHTVTREYGQSVETSWDAAMAAAKELDLAIQSEKHDALGGELLASRADGSAVTIDIAGIERERTRITVYVAPGDVEMARLTHEQIAEAMGLGEAKGGLFGGNALEAEYPAALEAAVAAARSACGALDFLKTRERAHETWAQIDARLRDSTPVRFRLEKAGDDGTWARFAAGTSKSREHEALVRRMRDEFERFLQPYLKPEASRPAAERAPAPTP
jgi:hypothetical protein